MFLSVLCAVPAGASNAFPANRQIPDSPLLQARAFLDVLCQWQNNLFYRPAREGDRIVYWRPGLSFSARGRAKTRFEAAFTADVQRFARRTDLDATHRQTSLSGRTGAGDFFFAGAADDRITRDRAFTTLTEILRRRDRDFSVSAGLDRNDREASLAVERFSRDYEARLDALDHEIWTVAPALRVDKGLWAWNARFSWTRYNYADVSPRDGAGVRLRAGVELKPGGFWEAWGGAGVRRRVFDGPALHRFFGPVADAGFRLTPGPRFTAALDLAADAPEAVVEPGSGFYREYRADLSATYRVGPRLSFQARQSGARQAYGDASHHPDFDGRRRDRAWSSSLRGNYWIFKQTSFWMEGAWEQRASNRASQKYRSAAITAGLRIEIEP